MGRFYASTERMPALTYGFHMIGKHFVRISRNADGNAKPSIFATAIGLWCESAARCDAFFTLLAPKKPGRMTPQPAGSGDGALGGIPL